MWVFCVKILYVSGGIFYMSYLSSIGWFQTIIHNEHVVAAKALQNNLYDLQIC